MSKESIVGCDKRPLGANALDEPQELGYRCPKGHCHITWSEYVRHIWCYVCEIDYLSVDECILVKDKWNPKGPEFEGMAIIEGMPNWNDDGDTFSDVPAHLLPSSPGQGADPDPSAKGGDGR